jgi:hypothetical protein
VEPDHGGSHQPSVRQLGAVKMLSGCGWPRAVPSLLTLCTACTPCTASASHAAWDTDGLSTSRRRCGSGQGFQVKPQRV